MRVKVEFRGAQSDRNEVHSGFNQPGRQQKRMTKFVLAKSITLGSLFLRKVECRPRLRRTDNVIGLLRKSTHTPDLVVELFESFKRSVQVIK